VPCIPDRWRARKIGWLAYLEQRIRDPKKMLDPMNSGNIWKREDLTWVILAEPIQELKDDPTRAAKISPRASMQSTDAAVPCSLASSRVVRRPW
jgi:hypothetical protein